MLYKHIIFLLGITLKIQTLRIIKFKLYTFVNFELCRLLMSTLKIIKAR